MLFLKENQQYQFSQELLQR